MRTENEFPEWVPRTRWSAALLVIGLMFVALNLRPAVAAIGPVLTEIRGDLGLSASMASLLTTIPILAFGVFAFATPALAQKLGMHRLLGGTMLALAAGIALRLAPGLEALFAGTILVGAAIAVANVVMPAAIKRDFARHSGLMMGLYSTALFLGAAAASGMTAPIASSLGGWRPALAVWAIPAVIALLLIIPQMIHSPRRRPDSGAVADAPAEPSEPIFLAMLRDPVAIAVTVLMGTQSLSYYAALTWFPALLADHGMDSGTAGWMLAFSTFPAIVASILAPMVANRIRPRWLPIGIAVVLTGVAYLGLATAPVEGAYAWMTLLGLGQGASISLALSAIVWRAPDARHAAQLSTMAQGLGYLLAGLGPVGLGWLRAISGGWAVPLAALGLLLIVQLIAGVAASRDRFVLRPVGDSPHGPRPGSPRLAPADAAR